MTFSVLQKKVILDWAFWFFWDLKFPSTLIHHHIWCSTNSHYPIVIFKSQLPLHAGGCAYCSGMCTDYRKPQERRQPAKCALHPPVRCALQGPCRRIDCGEGSYRRRYNGSGARLQPPVDRPPRKSRQDGGDAMHGARIGLHMGGTTMSLSTSSSLVESLARDFVCNLSINSIQLWSLPYLKTQKRVRYEFVLLPVWDWRDTGTIPSLLAGFPSFPQFSVVGSEMVFLVFLSFRSWDRGSLEGVRFFIRTDVFSRTDTAIAV
jgi:hypothetical protein